MKFEFSKPKLNREKQRPKTSQNRKIKIQIKRPLSKLTIKKEKEINSDSEADTNPFTMSTDPIFKNPMSSKHTKSISDFVDEHFPKYLKQIQKKKEKLILNKTEIIE